ncbi:hypothetical protein OEZ86_008906 [Tetradesmus obliquus]|nr:hypothetical protein OEZ86_008906 [Tetradesmus obliquus]
MPMKPSASSQSLGQVSEVSEENWSWFPGRTRNTSKEEGPDITLHIGSRDGGADTGAIFAAAAAEIPAGANPFKDEPLPPTKKLRNTLIWVALCVVIVVPAVVGPVYYFQVLLPREKAWKEANAPKPVPPLPPLVPLTEVFYDGFSSVSSVSWTPRVGNGLDKGWDFYGFGLSEKQCFTSDATSVAVIPDSAAPNNTVLRLQAVYYPTEITCMPNEAPFNSTKTSWTSGGLTSKSKRIFKAPLALAKGDAPTGNCTSLVIEARIKFPAVLGTRGGLRLFPEPQDQAADAPRCEWKDDCGKYGKWPASGEIGIADHRDMSTSVSHGIQLREYGQHAWRVSETPLADTSLDWHVYKLEWNCDYLRWFVDGQKTFAVSRFDVSEWPFDQPFFLETTYNVGGQLVDPNVATINSQMLIDFIRVYPSNMAEPPTSDVVKTAGADIIVTSSNSKVANGTAPTGTVDTTAASTPAAVSPTNVTVAVLPAASSSNSSTSSNNSSQSN